MGGVGMMRAFLSLLFNPGEAGYVSIVLRILIP